MNVIETTPAPTEFNEDYFRQMADLEDRHPWTASMRALTFELLRRHTGGPVERILDVGCGTGLFLSEWKTQHPGVCALGVDYFYQALRYARGREPGHWIAASAAALPFGAGSCDAIHCADVVQHLTLEESRAALDQFAQLLRPKGLLALRIRARRLFRNTPDVDYSHAFGASHLRGELRQRGLRLRFLAHVNSLPSLWAEFGSLTKGPSKTDLPVKGIQCRPAEDPRSVWVARYLKMERAWLLGAGRGLPFGHTLIAIGEKE